MLAPVFCQHIKVCCVAGSKGVGVCVLWLAGMTPEQWNEMMRDNDWNEVELRDSRYNQVVHMVSIADASTGRRRHFSSHEGMDLGTARQLDLAISQVCIYKNTGCTEVTTYLAGFISGAPLVSVTHQLITSHFEFCFISCLMQVFTCFSLKKVILWSLL